MKKRGGRVLKKIGGGKGVKKNKQKKHDVARLFFFLFIVTNLEELIQKLKKNYRTNNKTKKNQKRTFKN